MEVEARFGSVITPHTTTSVPDANANGGHWMISVDFKQEGLGERRGDETDTEKDRRRERKRQSGKEQERGREREKRGFWGGRLVGGSEQ